MSDDLVKRLRYEADGAEFSNRYADLVGEAADRIEALTAALESEQSKVSWMQDANEGLAFSKRKAFAALEKADLALLEIDALDPEGKIDGCSQAALRGLVLRMGEIARDAREARKLDA